MSPLLLAVKKDDTDGRGETAKTSTRSPVDTLKKDCDRHAEVTNKREWISAKPMLTEQANGNKWKRKCNNFLVGIEENPGPGAKRHLHNSPDSKEKLQMSRSEPAHQNEIFQAGYVQLNRNNALCRFYNSLGCKSRSKHLCSSNLHQGDCTYRRNSKLDGIEQANDNKWKRKCDDFLVGIETNPGPGEQCHFFHTNGGCKKGGNCKFKHLGTESEVSRIASLYAVIDSLRAQLDKRESNESHRERGRGLGGRGLGRDNDARALDHKEQPYNEYDNQR